MKRKISIIMLVILITLGLTNLKVYAATGSFSLSRSSMSIKKGKKDTFSIIVKNCEGQFTISSSDTSVATVSSSSEWLSGTTTITVTGKKAGTATITVNATDVADTSEQEVKGSKKIKVKVTEKKPENNPSNSTVPTTPTTPDTSTTKSDIATLKNLGITPNDFSGFRSGTTNYNVTVPNSVNKISIYATPTDSKATVSGTGSKTLNVGKNTFSVKVTAENKKTTKTYTLNITRKDEEEASTDATLKNLGITPNDFSGFKPGTTSYNVTVPNSVDKINIYGYATSSKAKVTGIGTKELNVGENKLEVKVTAEDKKTTKTYVLTITREEKEPEQDPEENTEEPTTEVVGITNILVNGYTLEPTFSNDVYEYKLNVKEEISKIDIKAETSSSSIQVDIVGNQELKKGENVITILAYDKDNDKTTTYQIIVNVGNEEIDVAEVNYAIDKAQTDLKKRLWIFRGTIILIIILIIVFLIHRYNLQKDETIEIQRYEKEDSDDGDYYQDDYKTTQKRKGKRFK